MSLPSLHRVPWLTCWVLAACSTYQPAPLATVSPLKSELASLHVVLPDGNAVSVTSPLTLQEVADLAVLNAPDLVAARTQHDVAAAELLSAGLPPDPSVTGGFAALLSGPASMPSISAGLVQDIGALITYRADRQAAQAGLGQVDAGILWQEWQVASQAEQLAVTLTADRAMLASLKQDAAILGPVDSEVQTQILQSNQTLADGSASMAAIATVQAALNTQTQATAHDRDQLDALLGLEPGTDVPLAPLDVTPPNPDVVAPAIATLAQRRPDLIALRYGYDQANAKLRAAILSQFLPISLGATGGRDTSGVNSAGPQVTLTLPLFNRNRGTIAVATATRTQLAAQYQASLAGAAGGANALSTSIGLLQAQTTDASAEAARAAAMATAARQAFASGEISAPAVANIQSAAGERERELIGLRAQLQTADISLAAMLGLGLPPLSLSPKDSTP
jgi:outer membrane protein TolC